MRVYREDINVWDTREILKSAQWWVDTLYFYLKREAVVEVEVLPQKNNTRVRLRLGMGSWAPVFVFHSEPGEKKQDLIDFVETVVMLAKIRAGVA